MKSSNIVIVECLFSSESEELHQEVVEDVLLTRVISGHHQIEGLVDVNLLIKTDAYLIPVVSPTGSKAVFEDKHDPELLLSIGHCFRLSVHWTIVTIAWTLWSVVRCTTVDDVKFILNGPISDTNAWISVCFWRV